MVYVVLILALAALCGQTQNTRLIHGRGWPLLGLLFLSAGIYHLVPLAYEISQARIQGFLLQPAILGLLCGLQILHAFVAIYFTLTGFEVRMGHWRRAIWGLLLQVPAPVVVVLQMLSISAFFYHFPGWSIRGVRFLGLIVTAAVYIAIWWIGGKAVGADRERLLEFTVIQNSLLIAVAVFLPTIATEIPGATLAFEFSCVRAGMVWGGILAGIGLGALMQPMWRRIRPLLSGKSRRPGGGLVDT